MSVIEAFREDDFLKSLRLWRLWTFIGWQDVRQRYRGSILGPFWIAGSVGVVTLGAGSLYSSLLKVPSHTLLPYISLSISLWLFVSLTILEGCHAFLIGGSIIRNTAMPLGIHVCRAIFRNLIVFAHNLPVVVIVFLLFGYMPSPDSLWAIPGFLLLLANIVWMAWIAALLSSRFPDVGQMIGFAMQFALFVTPVFWMSSQAGPRHLVLTFNPFHHLLAVVRDPIMGTPPTAENWLVVIGMAVIGLSFTAAAHHRMRGSVVFWL